MTITLAEIKEQARHRADMTNSDFVEDSELVSYINSSIAELHDILVQVYDGEYFISEYDFNAVVGQIDYALPSDFYKLKGVDIKFSNDWIPVKNFNFNERHRFSTVGAWAVNGLPNVRYRLVGDNLKFSPEPDATTTVKVWYVPTAVQLSDDADTLKNLNGYEEYVIVDTAIKMMQKEESDVSVLFAQKQALLNRITDAANNRDAGNSESVSDIHAENDDYYWKGRS